MTDYASYFDLVTETHVEIEGWFSGLEPGVLPTLLGRFSEQFSMITPSGKELDANAVEALFEQLRGARPGLKITLSATTLLVEIGAADADALGGHDQLAITHGTAESDLAEVEETLQNILKGTGTYIRA